MMGGACLASWITISYGDVRASHDHELQNNITKTVLPCFSDDDDSPSQGRACMEWAQPEAGLCKNAGVCCRRVQAKKLGREGQS
jgi:hypothetical protein